MSLPIEKVFYLDVKNKQQLLKEMFEKISDEDVDPLAFNDILERENIQSTAISHLVAIPHTKTDKVKKIVMGLAVTNKEIDYDGQKVRICIMFLIPENKTLQYLEILGKLSRTIDKTNFVEKVLNAKDEMEIKKIIGDL